ncbi:hypothetical protein [Altericroceibacterium endophyticum]|uniref:Uncharacterized protein n=1 Tax=Altericroceibacterium endophyticum TaxID=1808508 RepID=A0A6I4T005_9SPHN|nr:hypothetical protein [Altericroceibacterium endophyticum]MXO64287.1 hypothetical protein [Altericroceibacterium endophyticum]
MKKISILLLGSAILATSTPSQAAPPTCFYAALDYADARAERFTQAWEDIFFARLEETDCMQGSIE